MTPPTIFTLLALLPSLIGAAPVLTADNWTAGLDTTKPGWFMKHPVWLDMKAKFEKKCDSIEAALRKQIPGKRDSIVSDLLDTVVYRGEKLPFKARVFSKEYEQDWLASRFMVLRPTLLLSKPVEGSSPVAQISPMQKPFKAIRQHSYRFGTFSLLLDQEMPKNDPTDQGGMNRDSANFILPDSHPGMFLLLADSLGNPLGWAPWDSLVRFNDSSVVSASWPLYRDGYAELLDGWWRYKQYSRWLPLDDEPVSRGNPISPKELPTVLKIDMRRHLISALMMDAEGFSNIEEYWEWVNGLVKCGKTELIDLYMSESVNKKTRKKYWHFDAEKYRAIHKISVRASGWRQDKKTGACLEYSQNITRRQSYRPISIVGFSARFQKLNAQDCKPKPFNSDWDCKEGNYIVFGNDPPQYGLAVSVGNGDQEWILPQGQSIKITPEFVP